MGVHVLIISNSIMKISTQPCFSSVNQVGNGILDHDG